MNSKFNLYAEIYDFFYLDKDYKGEIGKIMLIIGEFYNTSPNNQVLEIGCGSGAYTNFLLNRFKLVHAIDNSNEMIKVSHKKFPDKKDSFFFSSISEWHNRCKSSNEKYDLILLLFHVYSYLSEAEICELHRLADLSLKPGGLLVFDFWNREGVVLNPPRDTKKRALVNGTEYIRYTKVNDFDTIENQVEIEFNFFEVRENLEDVNNKLFSEKHRMHFCSTSDIEKSFPSMQIVRSWDLLTDSKYAGEHYGNLIILKRHDESIEKVLK